MRSIGYRPHESMNVKQRGKITLLKYDFMVSYPHRSLDAAWTSVMRTGNSTSLAAVDGLGMLI